mmetsp:Transcript_17711/g.28783  ORF Transcript_17711/g.28783 Transcript_17711/m.28783 type:complete len:516 (+) Transcript_17711:67-1614(+)
MISQFQTPADHFNFSIDVNRALEIKKQQARAILDSLDDSAMMSLAQQFHERGLVNIPQLVASSQPQFGNSLSSSTAFAHRQAMGVSMAIDRHNMDAFTVGALPPGPLPNSCSSTAPSSSLGLPPGPVPSLSNFLPPMLPPTYPAAVGASFTMPSIHESLPPPPPHVAPNLPPGNWAPEPSLPNGPTYASSIDRWMGEQGFEAQTAESYDETIKKSEQTPSQSAFTTLILRNFPPSFHQEKVEEWVNNGGYEGLYDFLLWFPAKSTSRLNSCGYAFINFRKEADASRFMNEKHLSRFPDAYGENDGIESLPLSVAVAKVQGFAENYARFHHLTEERTATRCAPFFAKDAIATLSQGEIQAASEAKLDPHEHEVSGPVTTIVIRNLPHMIDGSDTARRWLDVAGYAQRYDFLLFLPGKRVRQKGMKNPAAPTHGYGYAFVNFKDPSDAQSCMEKLRGLMIGDAEVALNIVAAKIQGRAECLNHFSSLTDGGRCTAWIEPAKQPPPAILPVSQRASFL